MEVVILNIILALFFFISGVVSGVIATVAVLVFRLGDKDA